MPFGGEGDMSLSVLGPPTDQVPVLLSIDSSINRIEDAFGHGGLSGAYIAFDLVEPWDILEINFKVLKTLEIF